MPRGRGKNAAPISLFAFQDVLTAIMGIMLMITLMMALEQSGAGQQTPEAIPTTESVESLLARKTDLEQRIRSLRVQASARTDTPIGQLLTGRLELERLYAKIESVNADIARAYAAVAGTLDPSSNTATVLRELNLADQEVQRLSGELQLARDRRRMTYIISKQYPKKPIIVEIGDAEWHVTFDLESNTSFTLSAANLDGAISLLQSQVMDFPPIQYFVVLVVKPSGMNAYTKVDDMLDAQGYERGLEPLPEHWTTTAASTDISAGEDAR